jgi:hypothetical protein
LIPGASPGRFGLGLDIAARGGPHLPGAGAEARGFLEFADLAALEAAGGEGALQIGVADSSNTLAEAATIDGLKVKIPLPVKASA